MAGSDATAAGTASADTPLPPALFARLPPAPHRRGRSTGCDSEARSAAGVAALAFGRAAAGRYAAFPTAGRPSAGRWPPEFCYARAAGGDSGGVSRPRPGAAR